MQEPDSVLGLWGHAGCTWELLQERLTLGSSCPCQQEHLGLV